VAPEAFTDGAERGDGQWTGRRSGSEGSDTPSFPYPRDRYASRSHSRSSTPRRLSSSDSGSTSPLPRRSLSYSDPMNSYSFDEELDGDDFPGQEQGSVLQYATHREARTSASSGAGPVPLDFQGPGSEPAVTAGHQPSRPVIPSPTPGPVGDVLGGVGPLSIQPRRASATGPLDLHPSPDAEQVPSVGSACSPPGTPAPPPASHALSEPRGAGRSEPEGEDSRNGRGPEPVALDSTADEAPTNHRAPARPESERSSQPRADRREPDCRKAYGTTEPDVGADAVVTGVTLLSSEPACAHLDPPHEPGGGRSRGGGSVLWQCRSGPRGSSPK
jgi:hypothetical protein